MGASMISRTCLAAPPTGSESPLSSTVKQTRRDAAAARGPRDFERLGRRLGSLQTRSQTQASLLVLSVTEVRGGRYEARLEGDERVLCVSRQPFVDAARVLVREGFGPTAMLVMRRVGSNVDALRAWLGTVAKLTVRESGDGPPRFVLWKALSPDSGSPRIAPTERRATS
jgi:hypothetical protein